MGKGHVSNRGYLGVQHPALPSSTNAWWRSREAPRLAKERAKSISFVPEGGNTCIPIPAPQAHPQPRGGEQDALAAAVGRAAAPPVWQMGLLSTTLAIKTRHLSERRGCGKEEGEEEEDWSVGRLQLGFQPRGHHVEGPMWMLASRSSPSPCPSLLCPRSTGDES